MPHNPHNNTVTNTILRVFTAHVEYILQYVSHHISYVRIITYSNLIATRRCGDTSDIMCMCVLCECVCVLILVCHITYFTVCQAITRLRSEKIDCACSSCPIVFISRFIMIMLVGMNSVFTNVSELKFILNINSCDKEDQFY